MDIVCRLGGFMGSVGTMMRGSGLEEALGTVYGSNAVSHMIALRGHFLVEAALTNKLLVKVWPDYCNQAPGQECTAPSEECISPSYSVESTETQENGADIDLINKLDNYEADKICLLYVQ